MGLSNDTGYSDQFQKYLDFYKAEVRLKTHFSGVKEMTESYSKRSTARGFSGQEELMELVVSNEMEKYLQKANQVYILSKNLISYLKENRYLVTGLYIRLDSLSAIIAVSDNFLNDDDFVEIAYSRVNEYKKIFTQLFDEPLDLGFISSEKLEEALLREDGFGYTEKY